MNISIKTGKWVNVKSNVAALFFFQDSPGSEEWLDEINEAVGGKLSAILKLRDFTGELNETLLYYTPETAQIKRVMFVGLGKRKDFTPERAMQAFGSATKFAYKKKLKRILLSLSGIDQTGLSSKTVAKSAALGASLSLYNFTEYKTEKDKNPEVRDVTLFDTSRVQLDDLRAGAEEGAKIAEGVEFARDLANHPPNILTPEYLAKEAERIAKSGGMKCKVFGPDKLEKMEMNALLGVGKGSRKEPRLIVLEYKCGKEKAEKAAIIGKGLTFDAGGISLKPSKNMHEMKFDMCGAASVLGFMSVVADLKPDFDIVAVVASAENMPDGNALKPGDIVKAYTGTTVEIINTDAEGRLVLADALAYTEKEYKPGFMIDFATLTGAVIVALGHYATGMLGNDAALIKRVASAGKESGENVWELPLYPEFDEHLKSDVADIVNSNGSGGGTIYGAAFLQKFIGKTPWVHLDIAGTAWEVKEKSYLPKGPTGVGVRLLAELFKK